MSYFRGDPERDVITPWGRVPCSSTSHPSLSEVRVEDNGLAASSVVSDLAMPDRSDTSIHWLSSRNHPFQSTLLEPQSPTTFHHLSSEVSSSSLLIGSSNSQPNDETYLGEQHWTRMFSNSSQVSYDTTLPHASSSPNPHFASGSDSTYRGVAPFEVAERTPTGHSQNALFSTQSTQYALYDTIPSVASSSRAHPTESHSRSLPYAYDRGPIIPSQATSSYPPSYNHPHDPGSSSHSIQQITHHAEPEPIHHSFISPPQGPRAPIYNSNPHAPTRPRPHQCSHCGLAFERHHDLTRHMKQHDTTVPKLRCPHCGKSFSRSDSLRRHLAHSKRCVGRQFT